MSKFDDALAFTLAREGGYVNDPRDPGGPTNMGITMATLAQFRGEPVSAKDVEALSVASASMIYSERYWKPLACAKIFNGGIATALFDAGVLFGIFGAAVCMQRAAASQVPGVRDDGHIGPVSLEAINQAHPVVLMGSFKWCLSKRVDDIIARRPESAVYRDGWLARIDRYPGLVK